MYFSVTTQGFYDLDSPHQPSDVVSVTSSQEAEIRYKITDGYDVVSVSSSKITYKPIS